MNLNDDLVKINNLSYYKNGRVIFDNVNIYIPRAKITAIIGPSGIGKTTLLRLIGGQVHPNKGEIWIDNKNIIFLSRRDLYDLRKKMSMLFQSGALFTDINIFDNVAFPLRKHTNLSKKIIYNVVMMKLEAVGLRGAANMMPCDLSSGMSRRVALARAIALDPQLIMFDEPFVGQDPINMNILVQLIKNFNFALKITCIIVSHDIFEVFSIAHYAYIILDKNLMISGTPYDLRFSKNPLVRQFLDGNNIGPMSFDIPAKNYYIQLVNEENLCK